MMNLQILSGSAVLAPPIVACEYLLAEALIRAAFKADSRLFGSLQITDPDADAERLYERWGWQHVGVVPSFALYPDGRPCATTFYFKTLEDGLSAPAAP